MVMFPYNILFCSDTSLDHPSGRVAPMAAMRAVHPGLAKQSQPAMKAANSGLAKHSKTPSSTTTSR